VVIGIFGANRAAGVASLIAATSIGLAGFAHADTNGQMYGDPQAAAAYWRYQNQQDCGPMAVANVVGQITGREPAQPAIVLRSMLTKSEAHRGAIYRFDGTSPEDLVVLLEKFGIQSAMSNGNTMPALEQDLAGGHKVIVGVNAETLWNTRGQRTDVDHAGVDARADIVHLNDSGTPNGRDEQIPMATFTQAWATGNDLLIVTQ
jgi:predicted double-glycine peptidase